MSLPHLTSALSPPLRVGVAGLTRQGRFHLESFALHRGFVPVAAAGSGDADGIAGCRQVTLDRLLEEDVDLAVIATAAEDRTSLAREFLQRRTSVLIEAGIGKSHADSLKVCLQLAREHAAFCGVWQSALGEADFLAAKSVAEKPDQGEVRSVRFLQHSLAPGIRMAESIPLDGVVREPGLLEDSASDQARRRLAQLLELVPTPVKRIQQFVRCNDGVLFQTGDAGTDGPCQSEHATAVTLDIAFDSGTSALIDIDIAAPVTVQTGWILQRTRGGYAGHRATRVESDGELFSVPVPSTASEADSQYSELERVLRDSTEVQIAYSERSIEKELSLIDLLNHQTLSDQY